MIGNEPAEAEEAYPERMRYRALDAVFAEDTDSV